MESILVTGGAGFIGSNFVRQWLAEESTGLVNLDKLTYAGNLDSLADVVDGPQYLFVQGDICDGPLLSRLFEEHRPRAVVNFAAESHVDRSIDAPEAFVETNVVGTFRLLEASRAYWTQLPEPEKLRFRFLHVSTDEVYGSLGAGGQGSGARGQGSATRGQGPGVRGEGPGVRGGDFSRHYLPTRVGRGEADAGLGGRTAFTEGSPYRPNSPYAASKAAADHFARAYCHTYGLPVLVTNCSNNYGPYQFPEKLIPLMILNALEGKPLPVYGDGRQVRDWLYVEDHCRAIRAVLAQGIPGEVYNVGGDCELTNLEVVRSICAIVDRLRPDLPHLPCSRLITFVADRPGHDRRYAIDAGKIRTQLGWEPREDFESGLERTVRWYLDNAAWAQRITSGTYRRERLGLTGVRGGPAGRRTAA